MPSVEVAWGELIDKITILEIKQQRLTSPEAVDNVRRELAVLSRVVQELKPAASALDGLKQQLRSINETLWDIEDRIRAKEAAKSFDQQFIELARSVYFNNDERARIKRQINELMKSGLVEEKQYTAYTA
jgi:predicted  nucleic acid-binding Zn-ribbon protein